VVRAEDEINKEENREFLSCNGFDVIPLICEYLTPQIEETGPHLTLCCQQLLSVVARVGNAKENLVALLEQIDGFRSLVLVRRLLPALGIILLKIKDKSKSHSWDWSLDTVACHLKTLPTPQNTGLEGVERLTLDLTPEAVESLELLDDLVTFLEPLVNFAVSSPSDNENTQRRLVLTRFILIILGHPVASMSQQPEVSAKQTRLLPKSHEASSRLVSFIAELAGNMVMDVIEVNQLIKYKETAVDPNHVVAVGTYLYLVFSREMSLDKLPQVYSPASLVAMFSTYLVGLMKSKQEIVSFKGALLLDCLLKRIPAGSLSGDSSQNPALLDLIEPLTNLIIYHGLSEARGTGFESYKQLVNMFSPGARYQLYKYLINTVNHSGLLGWTVTHLKDTLVSVMKDSPSHPQYSGESLCVLLRTLFKLQNGAQTDLLEISDELIAEINLGYLLIAKISEKPEVNEVKSCITLWTTQIQEGLELSRAHWQLKLRDDTDSDAPESSVEVGGRALPAMEPAQLKKVIRSALSTLDLIQFNLFGLTNKL